MMADSQISAWGKAKYRARNLKSSSGAARLRKGELMKEKKSIRREMYILKPNKNAVYHYNAQNIV